MHMHTKIHYQIVMKKTSVLSQRKFKKCLPMVALTMSFGFPVTCIILKQSWSLFHRKSSPVVRTPDSHISVQKRNATFNTLSLTFFFLKNYSKLAFWTYQQYLTILGCCQKKNILQQRLQTWNLLLCSSWQQINLIYEFLIQQKNSFILLREKNMWRTYVAPTVNSILST